MDSAELLKRVRKIEIKTKGLSSQIFSGEYHSAFKGRGMAFSEVREYVEGDDVRNIDWNVTARFGNPYVKVFEEERELTVMLLVDVSESGMFGSTAMLKRELITELTATIAFSAIQNNDKAGVIFFSDKIEKYIPPKKGKSHILRIIRELINFKPESKGTDISLALKYLNNMIKKRCIAFVISDFMDSGFDDAIKVASKKHDLAALRIVDPREEEMPDVGLVRFKDAETGFVSVMDTSDANVRNNYRLYFQQSARLTSELLNKSGVDHVAIRTDQSYVKPLMNLFKQR
ncbi:MAG: DUF58 domain-containing protein [Bacteroidota bacterium]|mgnify:CR=1 FL=1|jgi:uncharacterized protein (DUF58 family)